MIQYGSDTAKELRFTGFAARAERRGQWIDVELTLEVAAETPVPNEISDLTALIICTTDGTIVQIVPLDAGCDCEFQFTVSEKEQLTGFFGSRQVQEAITDVTGPY